MKRTRLTGLTITFEDDGKLLARATTHSIGARLPPFAVAVLAYCSVVRDRQEVVAQFGEPGGILFDGLCDAGLLVSEEEASSTPSFFENFASIDIHRRMLADTRRLEVYRAAIEEVVNDESVVIDAGCGSGVLACMAAHAGAKRVYAVDNSDIIELATQVVDRSGLAEKVECVRSEIKNFKSSMPADVIVTETFGAFALAEGSLSDLSACKASNLIPSGVIIPNGITLYLAPTDDPALLNTAFGPFYGHEGFSLEPLAEAATRRAITLEVKPESLMSDGAPAWTFAYPGPTPSDVSALHFSPNRSGKLCGFVGWFTLHMSPSHDLETGPEAPSTHWHQVYFPVRGPNLTEADRIAVRAQMAIPPDDPRGLELTLAISAESYSKVHFFRIR